MTINKYTGKTKEEAIAAAKAELGEGIVIMNSKNKKPDGVLGILKPSIWEVTVAIEEDTDGSVTLIKKDPFPTSTFTALADEKIDLNENLVENEIKDAFREISKVVESAEEKNALHTIPAPTKPVAAKPVTAKPDFEKKETPSNISEFPVKEKEKNDTKRKGNNLPVIRMIYNTLIENEVDEKYINQILDDMGNILSSGNSVDFIISNIYQKMVLKMGSPKPISLVGKGPRVVFFVGPTGVGKTTTIAKIASMFKLEERKSVSFVTADTYRIAATDQLNSYANILDAPISIIYDPSELNGAIEGLKDQDIILVDTFGFSHKNDEQKKQTVELLNALDDKYQKDVFLVLSVTTKYKDLKEIADAYRDICDYNLIFTKLDETSAYGNILNIHCYSNAELSYITTGQSVPDDIETIDTQRIVKAMLGGK